MNIKKITAIIIAVLMLLTLTACRKTTDIDSVVSSINSDTTINYSNVEIVENESEPQSVIETTSDVESTPTVNNNNNNSSSTDSTVSVEEPNKNLNPDGVEIYGSGTSTDPYIDTPNADNHTVKTLSIPAGKSVIYNIYRVGGRILTINNANAYVVCDGTKYTAQNGKVSFKVIDALASDAVTFEIGNTGPSAVNFTITFADLEGSMANPTIVKNTDEKVTLSLEKGNEIGHFYKYKSTKKGTLKFYLLTGTDSGVLLATNNRNSAQRSTESSEADEVKTDDTGTYVELEVENGDEIIINVGAKPDKRGKYPAVNIEWLVQYK